MVGGAGGRCNIHGGASLVGPFVPVRNVKAAFDEASGRLADEKLEAYLLLALRNLVRLREAIAAVPQR
jgi:hypothetical protein